MIHYLPEEIGFAVYVAICAWALWRGGFVERATAVAVLVQLISSALVQNLRAVEAPQYGMFAIDVGLLALLAWLSFTSSRRWTLFATAFQLLSVGTHLAKMLDPSIHGWAYLTTAVLWGYAVLFALAVGTAQAARRTPARA